MLIPILRGREIQLCRLERQTHSMRSSSHRVREVFSRPQQALAGHTINAGLPVLRGCCRSGSGRVFWNSVPVY